MIPRLRDGAPGQSLASGKIHTVDIVLVIGEPDRLTKHAQQKIASPSARKRQTSPTPNMEAAEIAEVTGTDVSNAGVAGETAASHC